MKNLYSVLFYNTTTSSDKLIALWPSGVSLIFVQQDHKYFWQTELGYSPLVTNLVFVMKDGIFTVLNITILTDLERDYVFYEEIFPTCCWMTQDLLTTIVFRQLEAGLWFIDEHVWYLLITFFYQWTSVIFINNFVLWMNLSDN